MQKTIYISLILITLAITACTTVNKHVPPSSCNNRYEVSTGHVIETYEDEVGYYVSEYRYDQSLTPIVDRVITERKVVKINKSQWENVNCSDEGQSNSSNILNDVAMEELSPFTNIHTVINNDGEFYLDKYNGSTKNEIVVKVFSDQHRYLIVKVRPRPSYNDFNITVMVLKTDDIKNNRLVLHRGDVPLGDGWALLDKNIYNHSKTNIQLPTIDETKKVISSGTQQKLEKLFDSLSELGRELFNFQELGYFKDEETLGKLVQLLSNIRLTRL